MQQCWLIPARVLAWPGHVTWADVGSFEWVRVPSAGGVRGDTQHSLSSLQDIAPATCAHVV
ncbi:hypothetical protein COCC4DRAFT_31896 [Bipolaris maydis ATCC 48331]|uniref:Uncharacterized protein n=2 Tax=Cochliobolus heterostrophus TaxID=5016 RepID=M2SZR4_COCH5|nr:uncharacterized protein COCC4DRAFT_31896 [Bipolaris maydis ATCC 48331]EMD90830.1 hypothetical protein COCHEDRAFT_1021662 [Bipolaris maydis C5]ENI06084.1 hypothetical protein COCC4DRAFT_31896 [Bipolaris maydis ATCC 48331]